MTLGHDALLVVVGGLIGFASSFLALWAQRRWTVRDRRNKRDREALDLTVRHLMAWHDYARSLLVGRPDEAAKDRMEALDLRWEADVRLIPDREAAQELLRLCKGVMLDPSGAAGHGAATPTFDRLIVLGERVVESARRKRRELA